MQYKRFEDLPVWRDSVELARSIYEFAALDIFRRHPGLRDQLERAALSVSNNIAEGFERGTTNELPLHCPRFGRRGPFDDASIGNMGYLRQLQISDFKFHNSV